MKTRSFVPERLQESDDETGFADFGRTVAARFDSFSGHVFIAAAGVVVRCIAPLLRGKTVDPAVVVLDQNGYFAVSLIGGHLAGANALAARVAEIVDGQAVITTATDAAGLPALDVLARDLDLVADPAKGLKRMAASLLAGETVQVWDPELFFWPTLESRGDDKLFLHVQSLADWKDNRPGIRVCWRGEPSGPNQLFLRPRCLVAGLGFHRGVEAGELLTFISFVFQENGLALASLRTLATISSRRDEPGLRDAAEALGAEVLYFSRDHLARVTVPHPSSTTTRLVGTPNVCEAAAILASGNQSLLVCKTAAQAMTLAVALAA